MKQTITRISYKMLVVAMISIVFSFFLISSVSEAKLKLKPGEFYYTGTQEAEYVVEASIWEKVLNALAEIADYILGIFTLGARGVVVGFISIMEILLTVILHVDLDFVDFIGESIGASDPTASLDTYTKYIVNIEKILFNEIQILDVNIFK